MQLGFCTVLSASNRGMNVDIIKVEADVTNGLPEFLMVGYLSSEVKEASDRVKTAISNSNMEFPVRNVIVNLSPAYIRKKGAVFDLSIAVAVMAASGYINTKNTDNVLFAGELGLNGEIRGVKGILPMVLKAKEEGIKKCFVPKENEREAALAGNIKIIGVSSLKEAVLILQGKKKEVYAEGTDIDFEMSGNKAEVDFKDIKGQKAVKRAAEIAVAGGHNILVSGPPGSGKTMIAKAMAGIFPPMDIDEIFEVTKIYSVCGMLGENMPYIFERPFRAVHHTTTKTAISGGGNNPAPGEVSLAHKGILFLDELPEFRKEVIEVLREPLEEHKILISRNNGSYIFPSDFMLVAAMNPCPCGYYPDRNKCKCKDFEVERYRNKISGPFIDRIDICITAEKIKFNMLNDTGSEESSEEIRKRIIRCREIQKERFKNEQYKVNGRIGSSKIQEYCHLKKEDEELMEIIYKKLDMTARSYHKMLKVARTIADLDEKEEINEDHLMEAVAYSKF